MKKVLHLDGHKLIYHPYRTRLILDGVIAPLTVEIGPTSACNYNCTFCAFDYRKNVERLPLPALINSIASGLSVDSPYSIHLAGDGEPTLYSLLPEATRHFKAQGLGIGITTNGTGRESLLKIARDITWCRFSINAGTNDEYQRIHGTKIDINTIFETVLAVGVANKDLTVGVQCLLLEQDHTELLDLYERCVQAEVDYLAFKPYSHHPQSTHSFPEDEMETTRRIAQQIYNENDDKEHTPHIVVRSIPPPKNYTGCLAAGTAFWMICANGEVYPCAQFVGDHDWCMGNVKWQSYKEIKTSKQARAVIDTLRNHDCRTCRHPCRCDAANRYLHRLVSPESHDAFL